MTNETTASQHQINEVTITAAGPVGCAKSALLGEIEIMLKALDVPVRYADEKAAQAEKNGTHADWTASIEMYKPSVVLVESIIRQPKSIGDDAQFQAMTAFMLRSEYDVLVKLIDSFFRAPAAQASATIQAAPAIEVVREYFAGRDQWDFKVFDMTLKHGDKLYRAAPMVADPAGVAGFTLVAEVVNERKDDDGNPAGFQIVSSSTVNFDLEHLPHGTKLYTLAATVKAVPSEAMDDEQAYEQSAYRHFMTFEHFKAFRAECCAAPLADKTGGGE